MSWRFRRSFKIIPGLKLNLSKTGLSASIGAAPFTVNLGSRGLYGTASIPGTGISFRQRLSEESLSQPQPKHDLIQPSAPNALPSSPSSPPFVFDSNHPPTREIRSASTELMTSDGLKELKRLIQTAYEEREEISRDFSKAKTEDANATARFNSWNNGFLLKNIFKKSFEIRRVEAEVAAAKAVELEEQLRLTTISTQVELANEQAEPFFRMRDDFAALGECAAIWDVKSDRATDRVRERTIASRSVTRDRINFVLASCDLIQWEQEVPHMQNANGGDIYLYPGFILYRASKTAFSVIDCHNVNLTVAAIQFQEQSGVPSDAKVIGQTWAKTNKDGSRDKRFADNYQIPITAYGGLTIRSETGLWEEFQFSNPERLDRFAKSWAAFVSSFNHRISLLVERGNEPESTVGSPFESTPQRVGSEIYLECTKCRQPIEVNSEAAGQEFRCPGCGGQLVVPG